MPPAETPRRGIFLALGANLGDRRQSLDFAVKCLETKGIDVVRWSRIWVTEAIGGGEQPDFLNQALEVSTRLPPRALLEALLGCESAAGRTRAGRNAPRTLDIDILLDGDRILDRPGLQIPHPRMHLRRFVLAPLAEIAGPVRHPALGRSIAALLSGCRDPGRARLLEPPHRLVRPTGADVS